MSTDALSLLNRSYGAPEVALRSLKLRFRSQRSWRCCFGGTGEWGDGRSNCSAAAAEESHESAELAFVRVANISKFR
jgi:hypothetical protein